MDHLAFPFRFRGSLLKRSRPAEAVSSLIEAMARTPRASWAGCPFFGVRELLAEAHYRSEALAETAREMNRALKDLGIDLMQVDSIQPDSRSLGESTYVITLSSASDPAHTHSLKVKPLL